MLLTEREQGNGNRGIKIPDQFRIGKKNTVSRNSTWRRKNQ